MIILATIFWGFIAIAGLFAVGVFSCMLIVMLEALCEAKKKNATGLIKFRMASIVIIVLIPVLATMLLSRTDHSFLAVLSGCFTAAMFYACVLSRIWWNKRANIFIES